jgi:hypothetical protein
VVEKIGRPHPMLQVSRRTANGGVGVEMHRCTKYHGSFGYHHE